jgi:Heparinase II/III-like protein
MTAQALVFQLTGDVAYADRAIATALQLAADPGADPTLPAELALVYDWCHSRLTLAQRASLRGALGGWAADHATNPGNDLSGWGNYWPRWSYSYALMGLATFGEDSRALEWLEEYRHRRYRDLDQPALERIAAGGAWPEGGVYDPIANLARIEAIEAWRTATGEDLFESTSWFRERLGYLLLNSQPGLAEDASGYRFHPYNATGDSERQRGSMATYTRIMGLLLIQRFSSDPLARQLQAYLAASPSDETDSHSPWLEFLWFDPEVEADPPDRLTHYAAGTGTLLARSGWPGGAADDSSEPTYVTFQCGDHFSYHQHYDQNAFTLFKRADLLVDSGVYSGDGLSNHDVNYYARTIAHNTLVVYNPAEDLTAARPDARSNDGGQRTYYPASRGPLSAQEWDDAAEQHDTCDMLRVDDQPGYTYALGDATRAYNSLRYNQAQDTILAGNEAKVSRYQREIVYLRPEAAGTGEYLVLFDRVGVTRKAYSGENTKLLFHFLGEPDVRGRGVEVSPGETLYVGAPPVAASSGEGKVFLQFLLPAERNLRKVGGRGEKAFWVFGENFDWQWSPDEAQPRPTSDFETEPYGEWRLELEPADTALEHAFLTVIHPARHETRQMPPAELIEGTRVTGAQIADPAESRVVLFSSAPDGAPPEGVLAYRFRPINRSLHLIADLARGARYTRRVGPARQGLYSVRLIPDADGAEVVGPQGTLSFTIDAALGARDDRFDEPSSERASPPAP